jgi:hypothetical protein
MRQRHAMPEGFTRAWRTSTWPRGLAQPASAQAPSLPKACVATEALVGDGASGSSIGAGEVLRVSPGGQSTLTTNTAPMGTPNLDDPTDMAFLSNGDIVVTDVAAGTGNQRVLQIDPATGNRIVLTGAVVGSGPGGDRGGGGAGERGDLRDGRRRQPDHVR